MRVCACVCVHVCVRVCVCVHARVKLDNKAQYVKRTPLYDTEQPLGVVCLHLNGSMQLIIVMTPLYVAESPEHLCVYTQSLFYFWCTMGQLVPLQAASTASQNMYSHDTQMFRYVLRAMIT